jgi:hypothetical protein
MFAENVLHRFRFVNEQFPCDAVAVLLRRGLYKLSYFYSPLRSKFISSIASALLATRVSYCLSKEASTRLYRASHWVGPTSVVAILSKLWNSHRQRGGLFLLSLTRHLTALKCQFSQFIYSIIIHSITKNAITSNNPITLAP